MAKARRRTRARAAPSTPTPKRRESGAGLKQAGLVVSLVSGVFGVAYVGLQISERFNHSPPPEKTAQLSSRRFEADVPFGQYLARSGQSGASFEHRLVCPTAVIVFRVSTVGYDGKTLPLEWKLFSASGRPLYSSRLRSFTPTAVRRALNFDLPVGLPLAGGHFFILIRLLDEDGSTELDSLQTPTFVVPPKQPPPPSADCPRE
jgi:hypothetical protein